MRGQPAQGGRKLKRQLYSIALERFDLNQMRFPPAEYRLFAFSPTLRLRDDDDPPRPLGLFAVIRQEGLKQPADDDELAGLDVFRRVDDQHIFWLHRSAQYKRKFVH
ncbi:hypothetical protein D3C78_1635860 [compost metagenome]